MKRSSLFIGMAMTGQVFGQQVLSNADDLARKIRNVNGRTGEPTVFVNTISKNTLKSKGSYILSQSGECRVKVVGDNLKISYEGVDISGEVSPGLKIPQHFPLSPNHMLTSSGFNGWEGADAVTRGITVPSGQDIASTLSASHIMLLPYDRVVEERMDARRNCYFDDFKRSERWLYAAVTSLFNQEESKRFVQFKGTDEVTIGMIYQCESTFPSSMPVGTAPGWAPGSNSYSYAREVVFETFALNCKVDGDIARVVENENFQPSLADFEDPAYATPYISQTENKLSKIRGIPNSSKETLVKTASWGFPSGVEPSTRLANSTYLIPAKARLKSYLQRLTAENNKKINQIKAAASAFRIAPIHILASIAPEHSWNVGYNDHLQNRGYENSVVRSTLVNAMIDDMDAFNRFREFDEVRECVNSGKSVFEFDSVHNWYCYETVWTQLHDQSSYRNGTNGDVFKGSNRFMYKFFSPLGTGSTLGPGQLSGFRTLQVADLIEFYAKDDLQAIARDKKMDDIDGLYNFKIPTDYREGKDGAEIKRNLHNLFRGIIDFRVAVYYVAAIARAGMDYYENYALFDISLAPRVTSTLFNLGQFKKRAISSYNHNLMVLRTGEGQFSSPSENYFGWFAQYTMPEMCEALGTPVRNMGGGKIDYTPCLQVK